MLLGVTCSPLLGQAQTFTTLHSFTRLDGFSPVGGLVLSLGSLYGATASGGNATNGTIFKVNLDGTGFTNLYKFTGRGADDGAIPLDSLVLSGNTLCGTAMRGGSMGYGTVV